MSHLKTGKLSVQLVTVCFMTSFLFDEDSTGARNFRCFRSFRGEGGWVGSHINSFEDLGGLHERAKFVWH